LCVCLLLGGVLALPAGALAAPASPGENDAYHEAMLAIAQGRLADAQKFLSILTESEPLHAGARLDLALLYCAMGDAASANLLFDDIEQRFAPPPAIAAVIAQQRQQGCAGWRARSLGTLRLGRGFDSNVNQGALNPVFSLSSGLGQIDLVLLPAYLPQKDASNSLALEWQRELSPTGTAGTLQLQARQHDRQRAYDTAALFAGVEQPWHWGGWAARGGVTGGVSSLDGRLYTRQAQAQLELVPALNLPPEWQLGLGASWTGIRYPGLSQMDARWLESRLVLRYHRAGSGWQAQAGSLRDAQRGNRPGGDRSGWQLGLQGRIGLGAGVVGELGWQTQHWRGAQVYAPGLIDVVRRQHTRQLRAAVVYQPSEQQSLTLELKDVFNDENVSVFSYRERVVQLLWQWQLPMR